GGPITLFWESRGDIRESVRLVNGTSGCSGRVEFYHEGQWGTVCSNFPWDMHAARVVCKELGCGDPVEVLRSAEFGQGSGPIWMSEVSCWGTESRLRHCRSRTGHVHTCNHSDDAGVVCSGRNINCKYIIILLTNTEDTNQLFLRASGSVYSSPMPSPLCSGQVPELLESPPDVLHDCSLEPT
uniref:SRCR domain-containing protein n=1 Tax=Denticeps clupeoides TaxID=299321 RepID=A0AAY4A1U0_9TELE